jgi:hypothetical protein
MTHTRLSRFLPARTSCGHRRPISKNSAAVIFVRPIVAAAVLAGGLALPSSAGACPSCPIGNQARSEVWNQDFGFNVFVALLPFLVIGAICARVEAIGRRRPMAEDSKDDDLSSAK